jgi:hypothetical protein
LNTTSLEIDPTWLLFQSLHIFSDF